jgi:hypothetical protein
MHIRMSVWRMLPAALLLTACATPQERAIRSHCEIEAAKSIPQNIQVMRVSRQVYVGERTIGSRQKCRTENKTNVRRDGSVERIQDTVCTDEPIKESIYEPRLVDEMVDLNLAARGNFIQNCFQDSMAKGMFSYMR